jgi:hypothetical protein
MKAQAKAPADFRPKPADHITGVQSYLIAIFAVLSLVIILLAGIIIYQHRTAHEKNLQEGRAEKFEQSQDILSSIDIKIRKKLQAYKKE